MLKSPLLLRRSTATSKNENSQFTVHVTSLRKNWKNKIECITSITGNIKQWKISLSQRETEKKIQKQQQTGPMEKKHSYVVQVGSIM